MPHNPRVVSVERRTCACTSLRTPRVRARESCRENLSGGFGTEIWNLLLSCSFGPDLELHNSDPINCFTDTIRGCTVRSLLLLRRAMPLIALG